MIIYLIPELKSYNMVLVMNNRHGLGNKQTPEIIRNTRNKQSLNETRLHVMAILKQISTSKKGESEEILLNVIWS